MVIKRIGVLMKKIIQFIINGKGVERMRKIRQIIALLLSVAAVISVTGCEKINREEMFAPRRSEEDRKSDEMMQSIVDALDAEDADALKALFSPYAQEEITDLDEKIEELIEYYPGSEGGFEGDCVLERSSDYGVITLMLNGDYEVTYGDGQQYEVNFVTYPQNDKEPEKIGLYLIEVMTEEAMPEGFKWRNETDDPGIYIME